MKSVQKGLCLYHAESSAWPLIDLYETGSELVFEVDLPGIEPEDVSITAYADMLVIEGTKHDDRSESDRHYICMERGIRRFRRVIKFPVHVNVSEGAAYYERGVIRIRFRKREPESIAIAVRRVNE